MSAGAEGAGTGRQPGRRVASTPVAIGVSPEMRAEIAAAVAELEAKRESQQLEIVAFGTISSGKSSLLNALAGRPVFRTNVVGGTTATRSEIPWPAGRPGRARRYAGFGGSPRRSAGQRSGRRRQERRPRAVRRRWAAQSVRKRVARVRWPRWRNGSSSASTKRIGTTRTSATSCCSKSASKSRRPCAVADVVAVRSRPTSRRRVRVLSDGSEQDEEVPVEPDIGPLARRLLSIVQRDGRDLLLGQSAIAVARAGRRGERARAGGARCAGQRGDQQIHVGGGRCGGDQSVPAVGPGRRQCDHREDGARPGRRVSAADRRRHGRHAAGATRQEPGRDGRRIGGRAGAGRGNRLAAENGAGRRHDCRRCDSGFGASGGDAVDRPRVLRILPQRDAAAAGRPGRAGPPQVGRSHASQTNCES